ncbi:hypothetical protein AAC03nite_06360 [Alicyclobacillus acidoterrestris]|nr:hypothetical protein AAC03nite_06360 [Alicyclobacillus acidoterrestris]
MTAKTIRVGTGAITVSTVRAVTTRMPVGGLLTGNNVAMTIRV